MSPLHPGDPGDGHGDDDVDDADDEVGFRPPLPPEDRIWRHPSEVAATRAPVASTAGAGGAGRSSALAGVAVVSALAGAVLALGIAAAAGGFDQPTRLVERQVAVQPVTGTDSDASTVAAIATRTAPAVAALRMNRDGTTTPGSAIVYRSDGHLVTSGHLVDGADAIEVRTHGGWTGPATVLGIDELTDVAVLHVDAANLEPAALGSASGLRVGDRAVALGAAGDGGWSPAVATGVVSQLGRRMQSESGRALHDLIVVDVALDDGTHGGALLDRHGAVVAMTGAPTPAADLAAATPIDTVRRVAAQIIEHGRPRHVWLGVEGADLAAPAAMRMRIPGGAQVNRVVEGGPAAATGLPAGDVITRVDDTVIGSMSDLIAALRPHIPGDVVRLSVRRGDERLALEITLTERT